MKAPGLDYVAILIPQGGTYFMRTDGTAVTAVITGGIQLNSANGDFRVVYGLASLKQIRVIQGTGSAIAIEYYYFRTINV